MTRTLVVALVCLLPAACKQDTEEPPADLLDTGWFTDTANLDPASCVHRLDTTWPPDGVQGWYWRDRPQGWVTTDKPERYEISLGDVDGFQVTDEVTWSEEGLSFQPAYDGPLKPETTYVMRVRDCAERHTVTFRTSDYGKPLSGAPSDLVGRTYHLDLAGAQWVEPGGIAALLQLYFTAPVLIAVSYADGEQVDFIGGLGKLDVFGNVLQDTTATTWDFPMSDFSGKPYFEADSPNVVLTVDGVDIPVEQFRFSATFSAGMSRIGGGELQGMADTRDMGELLNQKGKLDAICAFAAGVGVQCQPCSDGEPYCLFMKAIGVQGSQVPNLTLVPRP